MRLNSDQVRYIWRTIAAINLISLGSLLIFRLGYTNSYSEYAHRVVSYEHGIIRRALVGEVYSWFFDRVPLWAVNIESLLTFGLAVWIGWLVFQRWAPTEALARLGVTCFLFGSPFLFKNFAGNLGKFDILGACLSLMAALLKPSVRAWLAVFGVSALLLFIHHLHATLYIPTTYGVLFIRSVACEKHSLASLSVPGVCLAGLAAVFVFLIGFTSPDISPIEFTAFLRSRAIAPVPDGEQFMWFSTLSEEMRRTRQLLLGHLLRIPIYVVLIGLHWPLVSFCSRRISEAALGNAKVHLAYLIVVALVLAGYLATMVVAFDYARFISDAFFCVAVLTQAYFIATTGSASAVKPIALGDIRVIMCAVAVAIVPWVGTVYPLI